MVYQEKLAMKAEIERLTEATVKQKHEEISGKDLMNNRYLVESRLRELEVENKALSQDRVKFEIEYRVLQEKYSELRKTYDAESQDTRFVMNKHKEEISNIELKFEKMAKQIDQLNLENTQLKIQDEKLRQDYLNSDKQREIYQEKYQDYKSRYKMLSSKLEDLEAEFRNLIYQRDYEQNERRKNEEVRRTRHDSKQKILEEFQSKINNYKQQIQNRTKREEYN